MLNIKILLKKFFKSGFALELITRILKFYVEIVFLTSKIIISVDNGSLSVLKSKKPCIITLWHGRICIIPKIMSRYGNFIILTSPHSDGRYIEKFISLYGHGVIKGSSNKRGLEATREIVKAIKNGDRIAITPDGPRGPGYVAKGSAVNIASKFNIPIISVCFSSSKRKILNTWDKFYIPLPFSKIKINISSPYLHSDNDLEKLTTSMNGQLKALDSKCSY